MKDSREYLNELAADIATEWDLYRNNQFSSLQASSDDGEAVCYLCLDGGVDESCEPLQRDCACRGTDAGFVHLECLTKYAAAKSVQWDGREMNEFSNPWHTCPNCHQEYQNYFAVDIATEFVSFVRRQYPDNTPKQVESLYVKLCALMDVFDRVPPVQKREAGVTANVILSFIDRMKNDAPLTRRYSKFEANAHGFHGRIALDEGSEESARRAVVHFERKIELSKAIGDDEGVATAKRNIAQAKSKYEGGRNSTEELLKASQELYELRVAKHGEGNLLTIDSGVIYAVNLQKANRGNEARDFLAKVLETSKQVLGSDHSTTKAVASALSTCRFLFG